MWVSMHTKSEQVRKTTHGGGATSKSKTHGKSKAKGRNNTSSGGSESDARVRTDKESNNFGMFVQSKREAIKENKQCTFLVEKIGHLEKVHDALVARHTLRHKWELKIEIETLKGLLHKRESGAEETEFEEILDKYVKAYNSTLFKGT